MAFGFVLAEKQIIVSPQKGTKKTLHRATAQHIDNKAELLR